MDNARRSGPVPVTFRPAIGAPGARRPVRPTRGAATHGALRRVRATAECGHRRGGQRPATVRHRARGSGPGCPTTCGESPITPGRHGAAPPDRSRFPCQAPHILRQTGLGGRSGAPKVRP
jgi:hypothetical protein